MRAAIERAASGGNEQIVEAASAVLTAIESGTIEWPVMGQPLYLHVTDRDLFPVWQAHRLSDISRADATLADPGD